VNTDLIVFRSTNADVLADWASLLDQRKADGDALHRFAAEVDPDHDRDLIQSGSSRTAVIGLGHTPGWPVPTGWRDVSNRGVIHIVPRLSTKAGKAAAKRLGELQPADPRTMLANRHGVPTAFFGSSAEGVRMFSPGVRQLGDALYVTWGAEPETPHDPAKWERVKLSDYYAAVEQADEVEAVAS
jgi:hypothetical protein